MSRRITKDTLSYYTGSKVTIGSLVHVPIRNQEVPGVVMQVNLVKHEKTAIKQSGYAVRKIAKLQGRNFLTPAFMDTCLEAAEYFTAAPSQVLVSMLPAAIISATDKIQSQTPRTKQKQSEVPADTLALQAEFDLRVHHYRAIIREAFAKGQSVFICVPNQRSAANLRQQLNKGISDYVFELHSGLSNKMCIERYNAAATATHPILIVGTYQYLSLPRTDYDMIIIESESARAYKLLRSPYLDIRTFATMYAHHVGARILYADFPLRIQTYAGTQHGTLHDFTKQKARADTSAEQTVVDMRVDKEHDKPFAVLSDPLVERLNQAVKVNHNFFLYNARKGLAPTTICQDCGTVVTCRTCEAPAVLHKGPDHNVFVCHKCGDDFSAHTVCTNCKGWKLKPLGVGIDRVVDSLSYLTDIPTPFVIDADRIKTAKAVESIVTDFYQTAGGVLVGTEMALPYLDKSIDHIAVTSIDSLLSLPDPNVYEHVFRLLIQLRSLAKRSFTIQTRQPDLPILEQVVRGALQTFYETEITDRERFGYPPFSILIKVSIIGTRQSIARDYPVVEKALAAFGAQTYPTLVRENKGSFALNILIKAKQWPNRHLHDVLRSLPRHIRIDVEPQNIL